MTKRLEELFNLDTADNSDDTMTEESVETEVPAELVTVDTLATIEKIESALPAVRDLTAADGEMDEMATLAKDAFNNLMDLGMQVDSRFSAEIFNSASSMLGHAITAKTAKINKKLKMIDLQLKKAELDRKIAASNSKQSPADVPTQGVGKVIDRGELLKSILAEAANKKQQNDK